MPTNLPPHYFEAEDEYRNAKTPDEKIRALKKMLSIMPKHKGTDKLQADLRKRISKHQAELRQDKKTGRKTFSYTVDKEGAGQVAIAGLPNSGKSSLVARLTNADPEVADYPFSTRQPLPAMMSFEDIQIQLIDIPPVYPDSSTHWIYDIMKRADLLLLVVDLSQDDPVKDVHTILGEFERYHLLLTAFIDSVESRPAMVVGTKLDVSGAERKAKDIRDNFCRTFECIFTSTATGEGISEFPEFVFRALDIVRVYTKEPGEKPDLGHPFTVPRGTTVMGLAGVIHKDFERELKFARIWGSEKYDGQTVNRDHVLEDGDVIELHV
jgi:hypothetical protein